METTLIEKEEFKIATEKETHCLCCGRSLEKIREELSINKIKPREYFEDKNGKKHFYTTPSKKFNIKGHVYSYSLTLNNCGYCGKKLEDEEINSSYEFMGMYGSSRASQNIVYGYICKNCKLKIEF